MTNRKSHISFRLVPNSATLNGPERGNGRYIGKRVVDFLLVLMELFTLGVMAEALRAKIERKSAISLQLSQLDPKFQVEGVAPTNHFCTIS